MSVSIFEHLLCTSLGQGLSIPDGELMAERGQAILTMLTRGCGQGCGVQTGATRRVSRGCSE